MVLPPEAVELIDSLRREIEALRAENAELRRRLNLDSSNSSKPPSSDGLKKKPRVLKSLRSRAAFPAGVISPAQYGERVRAAAVYLNAQQLVPEERTAQILQDLFGAAASCGASVAGWVRRKAEALEPIWRGIGACVAAAPVRCLDETGFRIAGATRWLHTASTLTHTFYRAGEPRSAVPEFEGGVVVHDHWRAYYALENVLHAFCNAHLLRELQAVSELDKEPWAEALRATLLDANEAVQTAKAEGASALPPKTVKAFEDRYWAAVREGLALHRSLPAFDPSKSPKKRKKLRPAHNLLIRFKTFQEATLRFLVDFAVPFTNNHDRPREQCMIAT